MLRGRDSVYISDASLRVDARPRGGRATLQGHGSCTQCVHAHLSSWLTEPSPSGYPSLPPLPPLLPWLISAAMISSRSNLHREGRYKFLRKGCWKYIWSLDDLSVEMGNTGAGTRGESGPAHAGGRDSYSGLCPGPCKANTSAGLHPGMEQTPPSVCLRGCFLPTT